VAKQRARRSPSVRTELAKKARDAALAAVQIFNNPSITFKAEIYVVLMVISWTYLLHAYFRGIAVDYRYFKITAAGRKKYDRTAKGAMKFWELERCLNDPQSPVDKDAANNLRFLVGLRHEIEHQMTTRIDDLLSARFQACSLNFNHYIKELIDDTYGIDRHLSFSLQFASLTEEHVDLLAKHTGLPGHVKKFIEGFDGALSPAEYNSPSYAYRVLFVAKTANHPGQADQVIEFIKPDSPLAQTVNRQYTMVKETEKPKYLPSKIIAIVKAEGFPRFTQHDHTALWKATDAKAAGKSFGTQIATAWYWYDSWLETVRKHCHANPAQYR
jgi:hypothetical protein